MAKTKIEYFEEQINYEDIKPGELIEVRREHDGARESYRGIAFQLRDKGGKSEAWYTSSQGLLCFPTTAATYWRITFA
jgi:hypothetical protein